MTSSYYETRGRNLDAPVIGTEEENYGVEAPNMTESVNKQITDQQKDIDSWAQLLISQYNHMHAEHSKWPSELLTLADKSYNVKKQWDDYQKKIEPYQRFHRSTVEYLNNVRAAKAEQGLEGGWIQEEDPKVLYNKAAIAVDKEVQGEEENRANEIEITSEVNAAAAQPDVSLEEKKELLQFGTRNSLRFEGLYAAEQNWEVYEAAADSTMKVVIPDGKGGWDLKVFNDASTPAEARMIKNAQLYHYLQANGDLAHGRTGMYKQKFVLPLMTKADASVKSQIEILAKAQEEAGNKIRAQDFRNQIKENPGIMVDHVNLYSKQLGSVAAAKADAVRITKQYIKTGEIKRPEVTAMLNYRFEAKDGSNPSIREYWKKETAEILKELRTVESEQRTDEENVVKAERERDAHEILAEARNRKVPYTSDEWFKIIQDYKLRHNIKDDSLLPQELRGYGTQQAVLDETIERDFYRRKNRGEELTARDLEGISDPELKAQLLQKLPQGGVNEDRMKSFITGAVVQKTKETDLRVDKTLKYRAYMDNAEIAFRRAYATARANGASHDEAETAAMDVVNRGLGIGPYQQDGDTNWASWGGALQDPSEVTNLGTTKAAIVKDRVGTLNSDKPWQGEEPHIAEALKYLNGDVTSMPSYYRLFPSIKRLPGNVVASPINLMKHRLKVLGLLKNDKPLPEDSLPLYLQDLLRKPDPSKTNRVIIEGNGAEVELTNSLEANRLYGTTPEEVVSQLRKNNQIALQYSSLDSSYSRTVDVPQELNDEFIAQVGDLPPYLQLNNLAPEVAKAFIGDVLT